MNLILCHTPLQALIAERITALFPQQAFALLMFSYTDNEKFRHYFQRLARHCAEAEFLLLDSGSRRRYAAQLLSLRCRPKRRWQTVLAASIDTPLVQTVLSRDDFAELATFDDGTANISPDSFFYQTPSFGKKLLRRLLGIRRQTDDLRRISARHYTLYPELPNIAAPTVALDLFGGQVSGSPAPNGGTDGTINVLLGQPLYQNPDSDRRLADALIRRFHISHYLPHPRENYAVTGATAVQTPLIAEDWLLQTAAQNPAAAVRVYTLCSSAALHLTAVPQLDIRAILPDAAFLQPLGLDAALFARPVFAHIYTIMRRLNIPILTP